MNDPREGQEGFDTRIADAARKLYNFPPETPSAAMWDEIEANLDSPASEVVSMPARRGRFTWWMGIAAALAVGLGIGRLSLEVPPDVPGPLEMASDARAPATHTRSTLPYVVATLEHLGKAESLLLMVRADAGSEGSAIALPARDLLARTRLLLGTPGAADPEIRSLLEDLELMLMQIVVTADTEDPQEAGIVGRSLEEGDLLLRLQSASSRALPVRGS